MSEWYEEEAKAECLGLRVKVTELEDINRIAALHVAELEAELATERKEHIEDEAVYVACIAENAAIVEAAREVLAEDCEGSINNWNPEMQIALDKLSALLQSEGEI